MLLNKVLIMLLKHQIPKNQNEALETKIVMLMKINPKIKQTEMAKELKVSRATVQRAIQVLGDKQ